MIIIVRQSTGSYLARVQGRGITASCSEGPLRAAERAAEKAGGIPDLLEEVSHDKGQGVYAYQLQEVQPDQ